MLADPGGMTQRQLTGVGRGCPTGLSVRFVMMDFKRGKGHCGEGKEQRAEGIRDLKDKGENCFAA
jgi:hypothetical protein